MTKGAQQLQRILSKPRTVVRTPTQTEVAQQVGISESFLSMLLSGKREPGRAVAVRIQKELGIPVEAWTR